MRSRIVIDGRSLQHPDFAGRGIGLHAATMLAAPQARQFAITLLLDPALPLPSDEILALADRVTTTAYDASRHPGLFLQPAPLSLPQGPILRLLRAPSVVAVAVVLDFIPQEFPDLYLTTPAARRGYRFGLATLRRYRHFLPISRATEARLHALVPSSRGASHVTGVAMRAGLIRATASPGFAEREGILVVAGDDPRKNPEVALRAGLDATIRIAGIADPARRAALAALHADSGGAPERLVFLPRLADSALADAYATARLVVAPSRAEGFSMPVIEAMAQGTPVLAADEPAQAELVARSERFAPDDAAALAALASRLLADPAAWAGIRRRQEGGWRAFTEAAVAGRFWSAIEAAADLPAPAVLRRARPRIALLSPLPPAASACADHSAALLAAMAPLAEVTAFSDTPAPAVPQGIGFGGAADPTVMRSSRFDAIIAVLGNSGFHRTEMRLLLDHGAAAILHDARMMGFYRGTLGPGRARGVAAAELGRDVEDAELDAWERDQAAMPARFLGEIAAVAAPLIVHAREVADFVAGRHGMAAVFLPFAPYRTLDPARLTEAGRAAARARLGIAPEDALIASFGHVHPDKCPESLLDGVAALRAVPGARTGCRLALVGAGDPQLIARLRARADALGLAGDRVLLQDSQLPETAYGDFLAAADCAVQLRRAPPGSISGALMDAIVAGVPAVASRTLVEALDPPATVLAVADDAPAEALARAIGAALATGRDAADAARRAVLRDRGMDRYAARLIEAVLQ